MMDPASYSEAVQGFEEHFVVRYRLISLDLAISGRQLLAEHVLQQADKCLDSL